MIKFHLVDMSVRNFTEKINEVTVICNDCGAVNCANFYVEPNRTVCSECESENVTVDSTGG